MRLFEESHWEINNLEIVNDGGPTLSGAADFRAGVLLSSENSGVDLTAIHGGLPLPSRRGLQRLWIGEPGGRARLARNQPR